MLDDIPDAELDRLAEMGFDWVWFLSIWQTGLAGQRVSRTNTEWRKEFQQTLPDLREEDIAGGFFICAVLGTVVFFTFRKKARLLQLAPEALLDRPFFFFGVRTVLFYTFFVFGMVITTALFWQRFFGTVVVGPVVATLCLSLISGLASWFINASTMPAMLRPD